MRITIDDETAKTLNKACWLLIATCNKNKLTKEKFEANEAIMEELEVTTEQLYELSELMKKVDKNLKKSKQ